MACTDRKFLLATDLDDTKFACDNGKVTLQKNPLPTASVFVAPGQTCGSTTISLGYSKSPNCAAPGGQTAGAWEVRDSLDAVVQSGTDLAGNVVLASLCAESGPFTAYYTVTDDCGTSEQVSQQFVVVPASPTAAVNVTDGQLCSSVSATLGYTADVGCATPGQTSGSWTVYDEGNGDAILGTGTDLATASPITLPDLCAPAVGPFRLEYTVVDACGQDTASDTFSVVAAPTLVTVPIKSSEPGNPQLSCLTVGGQSNLWINADGGAIQDDSIENHSVAALGGAVTIDNTTVKYGAGSLFFGDGASPSNGRVSVTDGAPGDDLSFGTGDFTIEGWVYPIDPGANGGIFFEGRVSSGGQPGLRLQFNSASGSSGDFYLNTGGGINEFGGVVKFNQWQHIAVVRESGGTSVYQDGVRVIGPVLDTLNYGNLSGAPSFGNRPWSTQSLLRFDGYMDDLRIKTGVADIPPPGGRPSLTLTDELETINGWEYNGNGYVNFTGLSNAIIANPTENTTVANISCQGGLLFVELEDTSPSALDAVYVDPAPLTAIVQIDPGQFADRVNVDLSAFKSPTCVPDTITSASWTLFDLDGITPLDTGTDLPGAFLDLDLLPYINAGDTANASYPADFGPFKFEYTVNDACSSDTTTVFFDTIPRLTSLFSYTGTTQTVGAAPAWANKAIVKMWGAGGGGAQATSNTPSSSFAGAGGFTSGEFTVADTATLAIVVGEGGLQAINCGVNCLTPVSRTYGGGGGSGDYVVGFQNTGQFGASGGGLSGIFDTTVTPVSPPAWDTTSTVGQDNAFLIAGGGGGNGTGGVINYGIGGAGGGIQGEDAASVNTEVNESPGDGRGGNQFGPPTGPSDPSAGGVSSAVPLYADPGDDGEPMQGGDGGNVFTNYPSAVHTSGGGGGGYWGGGGGSTAGIDGQPDFLVSDGAGGGGSGYIDGAVTNGNTESSAGQFPKYGNPGIPFEYDPDYAAAMATLTPAVPFGKGGDTGEDGGEGLVAVYWTI